MSCFIVDADNIRQQVEFIAYLLNSPEGAERAYNMYAPESVRAAFEACKTTDGYSAHKIYRALYIANLRAYNGRYNEHVKEFEKYTPSPLPQNMIALYKRMQCYLYQCAEDPIYNTDFYKAMEDLQNALAKGIICTLPEYEEADWN